MHILFDHNLPRKLRHHLPPHTVRLTKELEWNQFNNGDLLNLAQNEFDVLLTVDANIYHQQNVALYDIAVIVLRVYDNTYIDAEGRRSCLLIRPGVYCAPSWTDIASSH